MRFYTLRHATGYQMGKYAFRETAELALWDLPNPHAWTVVEVRG